MAEQNYHKLENQNNALKLRELIEPLPYYVREFFRGIEPRTSSRTRIAYAYDLNVFFQYLRDNNPIFKEKTIAEISLKDLESLHPIDIEEYLDYIKVYSSKDDLERTNDHPAIKRKLASLRTFYKYFYQKELITYNPVALVEMPKITEKNIIRLDADEVAELLNHVEIGTNLSKKQLLFHEKTKVRDLAIMTLLLGTGIRISECVGLNITDVNFKNGGISIHRKGGKEVTVYFGDEVEEVLQAYMEERKKIEPREGHENALFLSSHKSRITPRAIENMVEKYTMTIGTNKHITPHKLRSTYGTSLYRETGDIYLVADVLGHSDVNTTRKHYAAIEDEKRWLAKDKVRLRRE